MSGARDLLNGLGYDVEFEVADGCTWVALRPRSNPSFVVPRYGRGVSEEEAVESAARRFQVEQIGGEPTERSLP